MTHLVGKAVRIATLAMIAAVLLGVTALGGTLSQAIAGAYAAAAPISFQGMHFRRDIGRAF